MVLLSKLRLSVIANLVLTIVSFVLVAVALFAGRRPGPLENYAVLRVNTSMTTRAVIQNKLAEFTNSNDNGLNLRGGLADPLLENAPSNLEDWLGDIEKNITGTITSGVKNFTDTLADEVQRALGISDWYSLHVLDICLGEYTPNATASHPRRHTTKCTTSVSNRFNLTALLTHPFQLGGKMLTIDDIDWTGSIQDQIDNLNSNLLALTVLLSITMGLIGLAIFSTASSVAWPVKRSLAFANIGLTTLAWCIILGVSITVTVESSNTARKLNHAGQKFGVEAERGNQFLGIIWALMALMTIITLGWQFIQAFIRQEARRAEIFKSSAKITIGYAVTIRITRHRLRFSTSLFTSRHCPQKRRK